MKVQTVPLGLLAQLGAKDGQNPGQGADFVQPTLELGNHYTASSLDSAFTDAAGITNPGDNVALQIPTGQAWRMIALGFEASAATGAATPMISLTVIDSVTGVEVPLYNPSVHTLAVGGFVQAGVLFPQAFFPPGTRFRAVLMNDQGVVTFNLSVNASFQRLLV